MFNKTLSSIFLAAALLAGCTGPQDPRTAAEGRFDKDAAAAITDSGFKKITQLTEKSWTHDEGGNAVLSAYFLLVDSTAIEADSVVYAFKTWPTPAGESPMSALEGKYKYDPAHKTAPEKPACCHKP